MSTSLPCGPTDTSQVNITHVGRGAGLVHHFLLFLGAIPLLLKLLQVADQHLLNLLLAGFEAILGREWSRPENG